MLDILLNILLAQYKPSDLHEDILFSGIYGIERSLELFNIKASKNK